ncbi:MAG TPA: recombinase family protein, partial [Nostoc sp.]|uniref:recombinase family protein n=1 Tax=Nostoc sp. TaxID=1180 RepID=UPI002D653935
MQGMRIGLYARVSSEKQAQERTIESQILALKEFAISKGDVVDPDLFFVDDGVSGTTLERPGLDKLRDKAFHGKVNKVYVLSPDRLSRKSAHQILLIDELKRLSVSVVFYNREIGDTPEDQMLLQIQGVISEYEREKILERSRRGKLFAAKKGKVNVLGGAPFGYYYQKVSEGCEAAYVIHIEEAKIVREAFKLYCIKQFSIGEIAREFTRKEYKTRTGLTFWERSVIWGMLRNPAYAGNAAFRKTTRVRRDKKTKLAIESKHPLRSEKSSPRDRPKSDWITIPVPAIIDERTFKIAEVKLKQNQKLSPRNNKRYNYLLSGLLRCKTCGYSIYGKPASNSKYKRLYYRCMGQDGHRWPGGRVCKGHPVRVEAIDELVWESVKELLLDPSKVLEEYETRLSKAASNDNESKTNAKKAQLKNLTIEKERVVDLYQSGLIDKTDVGSRLEKIASKYNKLTQEVDFLQHQADERKALLTVVQNVADFVTKMHKNFDSCTFDERRKIIKLIVEEVSIDTEKEEIDVKHIIPTDPKKYPLCPGT